MPDRRDHPFMHHDRSRSPFNRRDHLARVPHLRSPEDYVQSHGPTEMFGSGAGRFHSPDSVRHKFFRENHGNQRPSDDNYTGHGPSPHSPHQGFGARYESYDPQSPISDRSPDHYTRHTRVFNSPNARRERTEDRIDTSTPERGRLSAITIDFDGLRDVPVGPRRSIGKIEAKKFEPDSPYILISPEHVPPLPHLTRHLQGMLRTQKPEAIIVDDEGWHLYYENSTSGRLKLKRCYHEYHRKEFFTYELNMQCFLNGAGAGNQHQQHARISLESNGNTGNPWPPPVPAKSSPKISRFAGREIAYPDPIPRSEARHIRESSQQEVNGASEDTPSRVLQHDPPLHLSAEGHVQSASPVNANISMLSQQSERDDTASQASGIARSDSSRIKRDKCHVCSGETGQGFSSLVQCSTCRRKYHRRCHQDPLIPDGLNNEYAWSCRSCVRKGRNHKGKQQGKIVKPVSNRGPTPCKVSPLPASLDTDGRKQRDESDASAPHVEAQALPSARVSVARPDSKKHELAINRHVTTKPDAEVVLDIGNGDLTLSDPDDLVEKSFSAAAATSQTQPQGQKPGKFKMTRTKLPQSAQVLKAQQTQPEESQSQVNPLQVSEHAQATSTHNDKDSNTSGHAARNSAAELRALAHKAHETHQSAVKNGTGAGVDSEERQSRGVHSKSTTKPSSVEQPTVQSGPSQVTGYARGDPFTSAAPTRLSQLEIPESPDEVRLGSMSRLEAAQDPRLLAKHARVSSGLSAEQMSDASPVQSGKHAASKKSKGPLFSCCSACQKRIPAGPSGVTRLCLGCKRKAAATEPPPAVNINPDIGATERAAAIVETAADEQRTTPLGDQGQLDSVAPSGAGAEQEPSAAVLQPHSNAHQASSVPPSVTQAHPTGVLEEDTTLHTVDEDGDIAMERTVPTGEAATTHPVVALDAPVPDRPHALASATNPPVDITSEHQNRSTQDAVDDVAKLPERIEYIQSIVGDSYNRPKGSRTILVAMAMSVCPTERMQAKDILDWISANIPTCKAGDGNWHERVVSQLTQGTRTKGVGGYWIMEEWKEGDGGVPGKKWYKLLPEKADEMWTWCPSRQRPVEPKRPSVAKASSLKRQRKSKSIGSATALRGTFLVSSASTLTTPLVTRPSTASNGTNGLDSSKQSSTTVARTPDRDVMGIDESLFTNAARVEDEQRIESRAAHSKESRATPVIDHASSDDEPLLKRRRRDELSKPRLPKLEYMQQHTPANTEMEDLPDAENENENEVTYVTATATATEHRDSLDLERSTEAPDSLVRRKKAKVVILNMREGSLSDGINTLPSPHQFVTSFYDEWPEYREEDLLDAQAKMEEIVKRPTRKQMFGKPALCSRLRVREPSVDVPANPVNVSPEKRTRLFIDPANPYPWEKEASSAFEEFESLDEFFDFPANVIPIISEGQLAYRDGTRNEYGRLPRAREVFKP